MSDRGLKLCIAVAGACMLAFQVWAKPRPQSDEIRARAQSFTDATAWHERVVPDFDLSLLDSSTFSMKEHVGRQVIVLNFFATWCVPCRTEMPELERYHQAHMGDGLLLLGVDADEKHDLVRDFVKEMQLTFPVGIDEGGRLGEIFGVSSYPTTIVVGADSRVKLYESGAISNADVALHTVIAPELATVQSGKGITAQAYREALAKDPHATNNDAAPRLEGRAKRIADAMPCPCGCADKVSGCGCATSKGIKTRLAAGGFDDKTDAEVMQGLNREFCMKSM